ncbi:MULTISPECIES: sensor histidine kinase [Bacillaceae]|uniref:histidine kinase n=1 Tax=Cytobacillus firmus TaxID=1399 RepID=A0AA46Q2Z3_CYTFI|nr:MULTISPECIES: histidine kinase [Bacillaceae]MBG9451616.1 ATP-binding protein [Cytobacillus firmus]MBG9587753.1 ATP-binding protein [Cytobacillus firmus]MCC3647197.1 sensor histidine kinase [Cytobacillus oceanisediminis]MCS0653748.1 histidine kinase [Cytobacillus firmus]MCU1806722.1 histidine kinase [Cytobacillus firmus]
METQPAKKNISSYIIQSQEDEIKRIALELHEGVGQTLYSLYTGMQFIQTAVDQPEMKDYIGDMAQMMEKTIQEIRLLAVELHPPALGTLGLLPALKSYLKLYTSTYGIIVDLQNEGKEVQIRERERITLFRVCQEALANIARYADTMSAGIILRWEPGKLSITIQDKGKGFDVDAAMKNSAGIAAMMERMLLINGRCVISSKIGEGTSIDITLPLY